MGMMVRQPGFTLAELLIALVILGLIATFTIPKVLQSQQSSKDKANAKEVAGMISGAYQAYRQNNTVTANTKFTDMTPYLNYVKVDTSTVIDDVPTEGTLNCATTAFFGCIRLHNGGMLEWPANNQRFNGTAITNGIEVLFDPDAKVSSGAGDTGVSVEFVLYYDGRITTWGNCLAGTANNTTTCDPGDHLDPTWFNWN